MTGATGDLELLRARLRAIGHPFHAGARLGVPVFASPEHAVLVLGPPRSGKTSSLIIPNVLMATGAVVSTSTKPDVLLATVGERSQVGRCWLFDPADTVTPPPGVERLRWSPIPACAGWENALLTVRAMVGARPHPPSHESTHWTERAEALLAPILHAAALEGFGMDDVMRWIHRRQLDPTLVALDRHGATMAADVLIGLAATDHRELSGIWSTAAGVLAAYRSEAAVASTLQPNLDPADLAADRDTVYICSSARHQHLVAPLVVGFLEQVRAGAYAAAPSSPPGAAPITLALDELANTAPLPDLPAMVSEGGSQGLLIMACLQDLSQARARWGEEAEGFLSLFGTKVILPGIGDLRTLELVSRLSGHVDAFVRSVTRQSGPSGPHASVTWSTRRQARLAVDEVSRLAPGSALLIDGPRRPECIQLTPWWSTPPFCRCGPPARQPSRNLELEP